MYSLLFVCTGNTIRSQIAEGFVRYFIKTHNLDQITVQSAGTKPASEVNPVAIQVMKEIGIDISPQHPKLLSTQIIRGVTHFILMGCGAEDSCPVPLFGTKVSDWDLENPAGKDISFFRQIRDQIQRLVTQLLTDLKLI